MVLTFAAPVLPPAKEEVDEDEEEFDSYRFWAVRSEYDIILDHRP